MQPAFTTLFAVFGLSCVLSLALVPVCRVLALRWKLVDRPDGRRKIHERVIPLCGGLAVLLSVSSLIAGVLTLPGPLGQVCRNQAWPLVGLFVASLAICAGRRTGRFWPVAPVGTSCLARSVPSSFDKKPGGHTSQQATWSVRRPPAVNENPCRDSCYGDNTCQKLRCNRGNGRTFAPLHFT